MRTFGPDLYMFGQGPPHAGMSLTLRRGAGVARLWTCFLTCMLDIVSGLARYLASDYRASSNLVDAPASPCPHLDSRLPAGRLSPGNLTLRHAVRIWPWSSATRYSGRHKCTTWATTTSSRLTLCYATARCIVTYTLLSRLIQLYMGPPNGFRACSDSRPSAPCRLCRSSTQRPRLEPCSAIVSDSRVSSLRCADCCGNHLSRVSGAV